MQTSSVQLGLIAALAVGLGFSLSSSDAVGYPAGPAVSTGENPVFSFGGDVGGHDTETIFVGQPEKRAIVTDFTVSVWDENDNCNGYGKVDLILGSSTVASLVAGIWTPSTNYTRYESVVQLQLSSGIPVDSIDTLQFRATTIRETSCTDGDLDFRYTASGYYAQP